MKIKGESMNWNSRVFNLFLKTDKSMINEVVELLFSQIHANRDRKGLIDQWQIYFATPGNFSSCPTSRMAVATNSETTNPLASVLVLEILCCHWMSGF
jgi:hypothetical protein